MFRLQFAVFVVIASSALPLAAQQPTTVQLPTFSIFTVSTTVSVPDGGGVYLGGVNRAASGRVERGPGVPFRNRAIGSTAAASGMHVSATIIDHKEMDAAILAEAAARRGGTPLTDERPAKAVAESELSRGVGPGRDSASSRDLSVAEIRRRQAAEVDTQSVEGLAYLTKAEQAVKDGKAGLAKVYYRMAAARLSGDAARQVASRLKALGN